jgi:hypothetical protein
VCSRRSLSSRSAPAAHLTKGNETPPTLVPKHEAHAAEALKQRKPGDATKLLMVAKRPWQPVIGDAAAQVMYMVHADVCGEPSQDTGQIVMRTAVQGGLLKGPLASWAQNVISNWYWT